MKFIHLSDLHIGKTVNGFSMIDEQKNAFCQILEYVQISRPSAVLIAGDVYDRAVPSVEAVRVFDDFLTSLANEDVVVLLIAGNHDSPERLAYASRLLEDKNIYLSGIFDGKMQSVTLKDAHGEVDFWMLPFIRPALAQSFFDVTKFDTYSDAISAILESSEIDKSKRNVLLSHQFYISTGVTPVRSESEITPVGGLDAINAGLLSTFDYVALGHLHGSQRVGSDNIRYAGSPIKYSFSEWKQNKSVLLIELKEKGNISTTMLAINPIHDMRELRGNLETLMTEGNLAGDERYDYLRIVLTDNEEVIDPLGKLRSIYPNVMALDFENLRTSIDISLIMANVDRVTTLSRYELFNDFFLEISGAVMSEEQMELARELLDTEESAS